MEVEEINNGHLFDFFDSMINCLRPHPGSNDDFTELAEIDSYVDIRDLLDGEFTYSEKWLVLVHLNLKC